MGFLLLALLGAAAASFVMFDSSDSENIPPDTDPCDHGDDTINGIAGDPGDNDLLAEGTDTAVGGAGEDTLRLSDTASGWGGTGDDTILARDESTAYGGDGNDFLSVSGDATGFGGCGEDDFSLRSGGTGFGGEGNDSFALSGSGTTAHGEAGDDSLEGLGDHTAHGGDGNDAFSLYGGTAAGDAGDDVILTQYGGLSEGGDGNDSLSARGSDINGNDGDDWLEVFGQGENADGGAGNDTLTVEDTDPTSTASLTGGAGQDIFTLGFEGAPDQPAVPYTGTGLRITDFNPDEDTLVIKGTQPTEITALANGDTGTELQLTFENGTVQSVFLDNITPDAIDIDAIQFEPDPVLPDATVTQLSNGGYQITLDAPAESRLIALIDENDTATGGTVPGGVGGQSPEIVKSNTMLVLLVPEGVDSPVDLTGTNFWYKFEDEILGDYLNYMNAEQVLQIDLDAFRETAGDATALPEIISNTSLELIETTSYSAFTYNPSTAFFSFADSSVIVPPATG